MDEIYYKWDEHHKTPHCHIFFAELALPIKVIPAEYIFYCRLPKYLPPIPLSARRVCSAV
jgi:hypothetical protein